MATLRLSPNEAAAMLKLEEEQRRLLRLKQVRDQERRIAAAKRGQFEVSLRKNMVALVSELQEDWQLHQHTRINELENIVYETDESIGAAYKGALQFRLHQKEELEKLRQEISQARHKEDERFLNAVEAVSDEKEMRDSRLREIIMNLRYARNIADQRAEKIARLGFLRRDAIPHESVPTSLPLQQQLYSERLRRGRNFQYDNTYFHRDYEVIRCDAEMAGPSAKDSAIATIEQCQINERMKQHEEGINRRRAQERYQHALHDQHMEKEKERLLHTLNVLDVHDRRRKQGVYDYGTVKNIATDPTRKQCLLEQFFEEQFDIEGIKQPVSPSIK